MKATQIVTVTSIGTSNKWTCPVYGFFTSTNQMYFLAEMNSQHMRNIWVYPRILVTYPTATKTVDLLGNVEVIESKITKRMKDIYEYLFQLNNSSRATLPESNMEWKLIKVTLKNALKSPVVVQHAS